MNQSLKSNLMLFFAALIWGAAFVAQKAGAALPPFTYNGVRMLLGGLVLLPVVPLLEKRGSGGPSDAAARARANRTALRGGICCGLILTVASNLQQFGMYFATDAGKAGFITSLYIVFVPVLGVFLKKRVRPVVWGCVALGAFGFYLLTMAGKAGGGRLQTGDLYVLLCSFVFALHILAVDHFVPHCSGARLSCVQFFTAGLVSLALMALFETPHLSDLLTYWLPILYCGIFSCGAGYTLQVLGQRHAEPTAATLILSLESVFAMLFGVLLAGERLSLTEGIGCAVIFVAVVIPQLPGRKRAVQAD